MAHGLDTTENLSAHGQQLLDAGYTFVGRYLSHSLWKNLTLAEARHLSEMGIYIVSVWESAGDHASFFTHAQGYADGAAAYTSALFMQQPKGSPIYFAVDYDASSLEGIEAYFKGVRDAFEQHGPIDAWNYFVGVYGSGLVCRHLLDIGYVSYTWLAQSSGWRETQEFRDSGRWNIKQGEETTFHGLDVDLDETSAHGGGGWHVQP